MSAVTKTLALVAFGASLIGVDTSDARADGPGFVILVHKSNTITSLSRAELKRAATGGTRQWANGAVVQLGIIPSDAPETRHLAALIDTSPRELVSRIQEQVFKGEMRRPVVLRTSADCAALAAANGGAICVASSTAAVPPDAHVIEIR